MSISIGDINLGQFTVDIEARILVLELLFDRIIASNPGVINIQDIETARQTAVAILNNKYPNMGITLK